MPLYSILSSLLAEIHQCGITSYYLMYWRNSPHPTFFSSSNHTLSCDLATSHSSTQPLDKWIHNTYHITSCTKTTAICLQTLNLCFPLNPPFSLLLRCFWRPVCWLNTSSCHAYLLTFVTLIPCVEMYCFPRTASFDASRCIGQTVTLSNSRWSGILFG